MTKHEPQKPSPRAGEFPSGEPWQWTREPRELATPAGLHDLGEWPSGGALDWNLTASEMGQALGEWVSGEPWEWAREPRVWN